MPVHSETILQLLQAADLQGVNTAMSYSIMACLPRQVGIAMFGGHHCPEGLHASSSYST